MIRFFGSYLRKQGGASAIEFALLGPLLIFMLVGTLDFGLFIKEKMQLQSMVSTTVDYVMRTQSDENIITVLQESYAGDTDDLTIESAFECECSDGVVQICPTDCGLNDYQRRFISVSASGVFEPLFPYPGIPDDMTLQSSARMRID